MDFFERNPLFSATYRCIGQVYRRCIGIGERYTPIDRSVPAPWTQHIGPFFPLPRRLGAKRGERYTRNCANWPNSGRVNTP